MLQRATPGGLIELHHSSSRPTGLALDATSLTQVRRSNRIREVVSPLRVLVGVDFSPESRAAVRAARDLIKRTSGDLTLAHVRPVSDIRAAVVEERGDLLRHPSGGLARAITAHYDERLGKMARRDKESYRLLRGDPAPGLCREAARGYDLLVMGTRGRGRGTAFLLGSTVQEALHRSPIPIVVVPARRGS